MLPMSLAAVSVMALPAETVRAETFWRVPVWVRLPVPPAVSETALPCALRLETEKLLASVKTMAPLASIVSAPMSLAILLSVTAPGALIVRSALRCRRSV